MLIYRLNIVFISFLAIAISACSDGSSNLSPTVKALSQQDKFCDVVSDYRSLYFSEKEKAFYIDQKTTLEVIVTERTEKLKSILGNGTVQNWNGTISKILVSEGKGAFLDVKLPCGTFLEPQDSLIIHIESELYQKLRKYSENSQIVFSGNFIIPPSDDAQGKYPHEIFYGEKSLTTEGSIKEPEFLFQFTDFH